MMFKKLQIFLQKYLLLFIVFITGGAILILEITATRVLSVFFGNTIYTVSSVISVILLALSGGYYIGGRLADKKGSELFFFQLIALSGLSVFLLQLAHIFLLPKVSEAFSLREGPIVASLLLFFLPSLLLGMLSPLVAKLQQTRLKKQGIGQITGDVFFWSTLGSIVGSIGSGFYLIPTFGLNQIIIGVGVVLLVIGIVGIMASGKSKLTGPKLLLFFLILPFLHAALLVLSDLRVNASVIHKQDGVYDTIVIYDGRFNGQKARFLQQSTDSSSAMYLDSPELVYEYTKYFEVYKLAGSTITDAMVIGGGAYSVPKALLQDSKKVRVDVAEIEPDLAALGRKYFQVPADPRLKNHVEDGRRLLKDSETKYDLIFSDAFHFSIPSHLTTQEFFELSKQKLKQNGVFVANIIGNLHEQKPSFLFSEIKTFQTVYPNSYFFAVDSPEAPYAQNVIMVGYNADHTNDLLSKKTNNGFLANLSEKRLDLTKYDLTPHPIFTDNYAPVEYFISQRLIQD